MTTLQAERLVRYNAELRNAATHALRIASARGRLLLSAQCTPEEAADASKLLGTVERFRDLTTGI